ncbi:MAG: hypothetical protein ABIR11_05890 [Candidatus Limnocylindrales bacterium]
MTGEIKRTGDWAGEEWAGEKPAADEDPNQDHWNKTEAVGDRGHGAPSPVDPATMPEGDVSITGNRHTPGESHWAGDGADAERPDRPSGDRPLDKG